MARNYKKWSEKSMAAAIEDVMKNNISYKDAADSHKVPLSTLRDRIRKDIKMAQNYKKWSEESMAAAIEDVMKNNISYIDAADSHKVPPSTLGERIRKAKKEGLSCLEAAQKKQSWSDESMAAAIKDFMTEMNQKEAAKTHKVPLSTFRQRIKKAKKKDPTFLEAVPRRLGSCETFSEAQEKEFIKHILVLKERRMLFGITSIDIRKLAFEFAEKNNIPHMFNKEKERAGKKWLYRFLSRHKQLSQMNFEEISPASAKGLNQKAFQSFFNLLESVYKKYNFLPKNIYNVDETGIIIEPKSSKVLALRGTKQVNYSSEKVLVTAETCMNAAGDYMPTMFIFPTKKARLALMDDAPPNSFAVYHESGSIQKDSFITWFKKFIEFSRPLREKPVLLLLDGHASHTKSVELIKLAQENNVILLSFPSHCTHRLQPLAISFIPPLMTYYKQEVQKWLIGHPGRCVTICKVAKLYGKAFSRAAERQTAIDGFEKSGIYPLNKNVLADLNVPSKTSEKSMQQKIQGDEARSVISGNEKIHPSTSMTSSNSPSQEEKHIQERNKKGEKTAILNSSPYKKQEMETATRKRKLEIETHKVEKLKKRKRQRNSTSSD